MYSFYNHCHYKTKWARGEKSSRAVFVHCARKGQRIHPVAHWRNGWDGKKEVERIIIRGVGGVTAFPHPPAQGQWDLLVWALWCGTRRESCSGALSAQSSGLKPGRTTSVRIVYYTQQQITKERKRSVPPDFSLRCKYAQISLSMATFAPYHCTPNTTQEATGDQTLLVTCITDSVWGRVGRSWVIRKKKQTPSMALNPKNCVGVEITESSECGERSQHDNVGV